MLGKRSRSHQEAASIQLAPSAPLAALSTISTVSLLLFTLARAAVVANTCTCRHIAMHHSCSGRWLTF